MSKSLYLVCFKKFLNVSQGLTTFPKISESLRKHHKVSQSLTFSRIHKVCAFANETILKVKHVYEPFEAPKKFRKKKEN